MAHQSDPIIIPVIQDDAERSEGQSAAGAVNVLICTLAALIWMLRSNHVQWSRVLTDEVRSMAFLCSETIGVFCAGQFAWHRVDKFSATPHGVRRAATTVVIALSMVALAAAVPAAIFAFIL